MGKKTSVYLPDGMAEAVKESGLTLRDLIHLGLNAKPCAIDPAEKDRTWITWWFCKPPVKGADFQCVRDGWHTSPDGVPVREIYEIDVYS